MQMEHFQVASLKESQDSLKETLTSRLIDRLLRPMFPNGFYNETQIICTVISQMMKMTLT